ncbi:prosaposin [Aplysia californica]|uniref:Prosaposin n=1 Tax=Aplysia californica TaxID=6500 RepID=A0ABM0ZZ95_APLCA|nr:prosaposin [Aplysia californica]
MGLPACVCVLLACCLAGADCFVLKNEKLTALPVPVESPESNNACDICVFVMEKLNFLIQMNNTRTDINATLYHLCDLLKGDLRKSCEAAVPWVESELEHGFDPQEACVRLGLCASPSRVSTQSQAHGDTNNMLQVPQSLDVPLRAKEVSQTNTLHVIRSLALSAAAAEADLNNLALCDLCLLAVAGLEQESFKDEPTALKTIENDFCHRLPPDTDKACLQALELEFPKWWDKFFSLLPQPKAACASIGLCPKAKSVNKEELSLR